MIRTAGVTGGLAAVLVAGFVATAGASPLAPLPSPALASLGARAAEPEAPRSAAATVLIRPARGASDAALRRAVERRGGALRGPVGATGFRVVATGGRSPREAARVLASDPAIAHAEPNHLRWADAAPSDLLYREGWNQRAHLGIVRLPLAWDASHGSSGVRLAVLDTGVDLDHPDLAPVLGPGFDAVDGDGVPADVNGHGTYIAGVAAAATDNGAGVAGAAWRAQVLPVRVLGPDGSGTDADIAEGITWAADQGADVINLALGGPARSSVLLAAIQYAQERDAVVVASAGNEGTATPHYPAAYGTVLAVAATSASGDAAWYSNRGEWVDLAAPGHDVAGTALGASERYGIASGTSPAAALTSGVAALVRARQPGLRQGAVATRLAATARDAGPQGRDPFYGRGLLDAAAATGSTAQAPLRPPAGDAREPNGTPDRAYAITDPYFEHGTISPQGDVDWWRLDAPAGLVRFRVESGADDAWAERMSPEVQVFGADLRPLSQRLVGDSSVTVDVGVPAAQRVYLRVTNQWSSRGRLSNATPWSYTIKHESGSWPVRAPSSGPLWVRDASPADFSLGVASTVQPTVEFGRPLQAASVTSDRVRLLDGTTNARVAATVSYDSPTRTATIHPSAPLAVGRPYRLQVAGVTDTGGVQMGTAFASRFTVGTTPDSTPPETTLTFALWGGLHQDTGFDFVSGEPGSRFECIDDTARSFHACDTPERFALIPPGTRTYRVRAIDAAGNVDASPAARTWTMPPPNDAFSSARTLTGTSGRVSGASVMATSEPGEPAHAGEGGRSVWYSWTAPGAGSLTVDTFGSEFPTALALYTGSAVGTLVERGSSLDWRGTGWSSVTTPVQAGTTYRIAVDGAHRTYVQRGWIELSWRFAAAP